MPYKFYGRDMQGMYFFIFASCEALKNVFINYDIIARMEVMTVIYYAHDASYYVFNFFCVFVDIRSVVHVEIQTLRDDNCMLLAHGP